MVSAFGFVLSIQGYLLFSIPTVFFCVGLLLIYIDLMVLSTTGLRIVSSVLFGFVLFLSVYGIVQTNYVLLSNEEHQIVVETKELFSGFDLLTHEPETIYEVIFYESDGLFSKMIGSRSYINDNPYQFVIENDQLLIIDETQPSEPADLIELD